MADAPERPLRWVGPSRRELKEFPVEVQKVMGYALFLAQIGVKHPDAKPLKGHRGAGVEVAEDFKTTPIARSIRSGFMRLFTSSTRFRRSRRGDSDAEAHSGCGQRPARGAAAPSGRIRVQAIQGGEPMSEELEVSVSSGNVFEDLGLADSGELMAKAKLAAQVSSILQHRHLTQAAAAEILGITQPRVSDLARGRLEKFSLASLLQFLLLLDRDVEIVVRKKPRSRKRAHLSVAA
jgi:predicted XRE-type DNA-binding protein